MRAFALQPSSGNCSPTLELVLWKVIFPHVFFPGGVSISQTPLSMGSSRESGKGGWAKWGMATVTSKHQRVKRSLVFVKNPVAPPQLWFIWLIWGNLHLTLGHFTHIEPSPIVHPHLLLAYTGDVGMRGCVEYANYQTNTFTPIEPSPMFHSPFCLLVYSITINSNNKTINNNNTQ